MDGVELGRLRDNNEFQMKLQISIFRSLARQALTRPDQYSGRHTCLIRAFSHILLLDYLYILLWTNNYISEGS